MWVLENLEDIKSDFSAFHRVDEIEEIPASWFFPRARRLVAYKGALRLTAEKESEESKKSPTGRERAVDRHYSSPEHNTEANVLGLFEKGTG